MRHRVIEGLRSETAALLTLQRSDRPWQLPFAAALASGVPFAVGVYHGLPSEGALGAVAGLSFLYLPATRLRHRIPTIMASALAMLSSYAIGLAGQASPAMAVIVIAFVAAAAALFCRSQAVVPPGPIFMVMAGAIAAFSPVQTSAVENLGYFALGCIWACAIAIAYSAYILRARPRTGLRVPTRMAMDAALIDSILIGVFVGASLALARLLGLEKAYWVPVSCLAVMQGVTLRASWRRNIHRIVGTVIGMGLTWTLLPILTEGWAVAAAVMLLTFLIETAVVRHYAFAAIFITPLTILLAEVSRPGMTSPEILMQARLMDTIVGALIGLAGAVCLHNQPLRRFLTGALGAIRPRRPLI